MPTDLTKKILFVLTIASTFISCSPTDPAFDAEGDIEKGKVRLISYGFSFPLPPPYTNYNRQLDSLRKVYGIEYDNRGCMTDSVSLAKMKDYNNIVITHLAKRNGDNWYEKYQQQANSLYELAKKRAPTDSTAFNSKWSNGHVIVHHQSTGSDTWTDLFIPLAEHLTPKTFENVLAFDKENDIVVYEYPSLSGDTILIAENIWSTKKQIIGKELKKCSSAFPHYCIDSISITKKVLYLEWVLSNRIKKQNSKETKRIRLDV